MKEEQEGRTADGQEATKSSKGEWREREALWEAEAEGGMLKEDEEAKLDCLGDHC